MIFLIVFGGLMLILGGFYLANSWQQYREWKGGTIIVVLSLAAVIYGVINLPAFNHNKQDSSAASSSQVTTTSGRAAFSNKANIGSGNGSASQENKEMAILRQLQKGYAKFGDVSFDSKTKTYKVTPTDDDTVNALKQLAQDPSQAEQMGWSKLTDSFKKNSKDIDKAMGTDYSISIMNPGDDSQAMYTAKNGKTTYDIANQ
ncbi:DUF308 domain-containing protein [Limosilactobacillus fastidiosus]|uniref:DUF308 domain-containing protein n=1 Tax=Limosilactobacillus fastidiosus TaxID=2759855 RepID=A0A7W3U0X3_9LACO|nr:DUF308 domain-containing protein [Limosilactobacillus fastidiosus]MBB1062301.1 DUF308 domain-containing protein [Limosilactobacillus fastidiosus]MBB1086630.1 DUF308 domain-containing protein [Limosilactobacillus fastidiosus]MCD7083378.1 DUF308 domain-containing protein [Limosilactobacillus fastidiosus]MCD7085101.1 DUF308 domain-containing protein [Limosilactobacillus fastidiosus]MCD7115313.1 DUF308 domain-containing protein [Limosilactobacillus fastidiosus]